VKVGKKIKSKFFYILGSLLELIKKTGDLESFFFRNLANLGQNFHGKSFV
jgi:hypothetical protein